MSDSHLTEFSIEIPNRAHWALKSLNELCDVISRGTAPIYVEQSDVLAIGQRCVASSGFMSGHARPHSSRAMKNVLRPEIGDVLLNSTGAGTIGRSAVFDEAGIFIVDGHVTAIRSRKEAASPHWINAVLKTFWAQRHLERFCYSGSTNQLELNQTQLRNTRLPVPTFAEQLAFEQVFHACDTAIEQTEQMIGKLEAVKQGLLQDLLTRGIDANGELRPLQSEAPHLYKQSPLGTVPKLWELVTLGDVADSLVDGPFGSNLKTAHYVDDAGVRVVRLQNILPDEYDDSQQAFISDKHAASLSRNRVVSGDVLVASLGDANYPVGRACCYPTDLPDAINKADCFRFRSGSRCINPFVMHYLNSTAARMQASRYEQGVTMKRINLGNLRRIIIALPSVAEQELIVARLGAVQIQIDVVMQRYRKLQQEKAGLMDDLLTGRVRVTPLLEKANEHTLDACA